MMSIKGFKSQQALARKLGGYTEQESLDPGRYVTVQEMSGRRHALDVMMQGAFKIVDGLTVEAGSSIRVIKCTAHGANKNDIIRLSDGTQFSALSIPDADTIITSVELDVDPTGDIFAVWRHVTPAYTSEGYVVAASGPVQFNKDGSDVVVTEDSAVEANNAPLPSGLMIKKDDGKYYPVTLDTTNPYAHTPIPVCITDVTGTTNVTINAGDIAVGIKHNGADPSSVRIGDGTNLASVSAANALKVDGSAVTQPVSGTFFQATQPVSLASVPLATGAATSDNQTNGTQQTKIGNGTITAEVKSLATPLLSADNSLTVSAVLHGETTGGGGGYVDVKVNPSGALVTETTLAASVATRIGTVAVDQTTPGTTNAVSVTNLPTTADTNTGAASASTLRSVLATRHETVSTPLAVRPGSGSVFYSSVALSAAQLTTGALAQVPASASIGLGWDGATHRELAVDTSGQLKTVAQTSSGTITQNKITVGTSAVRSTVAGTAPSASRKKMIISPLKTNTGAIYLGASTVTTSNGLEIIGPDRLEFLLDASDYYLISDTAGQEVRIIEVV
jgi:hypothetical protein